MAGIKLEKFQGLIPRASDRLLPPMGATVARNTKLLQGELRGYRAPREVADLTGEYITIRTAFRVRDPGGEYADEWLTFDSRDVDVVRSPIVNDQFDRYYWAGDGRPMYNTRERIFDGLSAFFLGVPIPTIAPTVVPPGTVYLDQTRAYVYTFVSAYGEEGQPSPPTLAVGDEGTWAISGMQTAVPDAADRNITKKNIYRTVPGNSSSVFFFVDQIDVGDATFNDSETDFDVALNNILESQTWAEPILDMEGFSLMPNGYLVGWAGRRLVFSEAYRPHAWPAEYELSTEFEVVGLVVWGATIVIGTESHPYMGQGVTPRAFTMQKMDAVEPCLSRQGMVATVWGAYYPSINGLTLVNSSGVKNITQDILTKEEWSTYNPEDIFAAQLGLEYIAFNSPNFGFVFNPTEQLIKLIELDRFTGVNGIETDPYSGNVLLLMQDRVWDWDPPNVERLFWRWKSKKYHIKKPMNFGAARLSFETGTVDVGDDTLEYYGTYNLQLFNAALTSSISPLTEAGLNTLGGHVLCGFPAQAEGLVSSWTEPEILSPLGGSLLYPIQFMLFQGSTVRLIVHASDTIVLDTMVVDESIIRLPTGFKSDLWQFEFIGNTIMYSLQVAETAKGLAEV
jgi:hypothetical protein